MIITFNGRVTTSEAEEEKVFSVMKQFLTEQFQDYNFEVSGKKETLRHTQKKIEIKEKEKVEEDKQTKQIGLK